MKRPDALPMLADLANDLAAAPSVGAAILVLQRGAGTLLGHRLFSVMRHDAAGGWNARIHSSQPRHYPAGGRKPVQPGPWAECLFRRGEPWLCRDLAAVRATFPDHALIEALGCGAALNLPVRWQGRTLGTVNLLDAEGSYGPEDVPAGVVLAGLAAPVLLALGAEPG